MADQPTDGQTPTRQIQAEGMRRYKESVIIMQATWFGGFFNRQYERLSVPKGAND